jgi:hypothetical protein
MIQERIFEYEIMGSAWGQHTKPRNIKTICTILRSNAEAQKSQIAQTKQLEQDSNWYD